MIQPPIVHEENGNWYFWDETWADRAGPFNTEEEATNALNRYIRWLEKGEIC